MTTEYSIGIDLGGTKILAAIVNEKTGEIITEVKNKTKKEKGEEKIAKILLDTIEELLATTEIKKEEIKSIGIGLAGQVDRKNGILLNSPNINCQNLEVKKIVEEKFAIPTYIGNDVEVATIGEMTFGAGKGYSDLCCIFIGTGVGSTIVQDGKIRRGYTGSAGEIGHIIVDSNGRVCGCGGNGCLEAYASRSAIETRILGAIKKGRKSIITDLSKLKSISTKHIKQALDAHDEVVTSYVNEAIQYLGIGVASIMNFYNPELIILGGGLIQGIDEFYIQTIKSARAKSLPVCAHSTTFKKAELGDYSGVVGASLLRWRDK
ncbi:ROK family protein [bacterium]|nr:ROK family protein [bacterium]